MVAILSSKAKLSEQSDGFIPKCAIFHCIFALVDFLGTAKTPVNTNIPVSAYNTKVVVAQQLPYILSSNGTILSFGRFFFWWPGTNS